MDDNTVTIDNTVLQSIIYAVTARADILWAGLVCAVRTQSVYSIVFLELKRTQYRTVSKIVTHLSTVAYNHSIKIQYLFTWVETIKWKWVLHKNSMQ